MYTYADVIFEAETRRRNLQDEVEQQRLVRLAATGRTQAERDWGVRRLAVQLADYVSGLRCLMHRAFASEPGAAAC
jgi:ribosomal protein S6